MAVAKPDEVLNRELESILPAKIKCDETEAKHNKAVLKAVIEDCLISKMRKVDGLFDLLYQHIYYTGSYYEGLRIKSADEFDLNVVLKLPIKPEDRKIISDGRGIPRSFCLYELKSSLSALLSNHRDWNTLRSMESLIFENNRLSPEKIRRWMQSVADRALPDIGNIKGVKRIAPSQHGPAKTLYIYLTNGKKIDVDLVPVIEIKWPEWPLGARKTPATRFVQSPGKRFWFLVPKPYKGEQNPAHKELLWRLHFPEIEKAVLMDRGCVKPLIKLLKLLRDCQRWDAIASYYIKTVVLWEVEQHSDAAYWNKNKLGELFVLLLKKLLNYIRQGHLPYYFYREYSLIDGMAASHRDNVASRIQRILNILDKQPDRIGEFFK